MKRQIFTLILIGITFNIFADSSRKTNILEGQWVLDHDMTFSFNETHVKMSQKQKNFLKKFQNKMTIVFMNNVVTVHGPEHIDDRDQKNIIKRPAYTVTATYKILHHNHEQVVILITFKDGREQIQLMNFDNSNSHWIYLGHGLSGEQPNARQYFKKEPSYKSESK